MDYLNFLAKCFLIVSLPIFTIIFLEHRDKGKHCKVRPQQLGCPGFPPAPKAATVFDEFRRRYDN